MSEFFRDSDRFGDLERKILPMLLGGSTAGVKVWSAGCSIGAEPYSMSIILRELALGRNHSIMATDIDQTILDRARAGRDYLASDIRNVGSARMAKWFTLQPDGRYSVGAQPRTMITFQKHDLLRDRYPRGPFDLVSCRNVVIYFTEEAKERIYQGLRQLAAAGRHSVRRWHRSHHASAGAGSEGRRAWLLPHGARVVIGGGLHTRGPQSPEALVAAAPELEALPIVAQRVLAILRDERTTIDGISKLLGTDQALASAVLRHANSASAMPNRKIANLREGIARIGQRALSQVLVRACAAPMLDRGLPPYALPRRVAWRHAATTSLAARLLATQLKIGSPEEASVAGLLHDVGKIVLTSVCPEDAAAAVSLARSRRVQVWQAEEHVFGFHHGAVGAALLSSWDLPEAVVDAVAFHHQPHMSQQPLATVVNLADASAHAAGAVGGGGACPAAELDLAAADALGASEADMLAFLESLQCVEEGEL